MKHSFGKFSHSFMHIPEFILKCNAHDTILANGQISSPLLNQEIFCLVFRVTFWFFVGLRTEICDHAEKIGEEISSCIPKIRRVTFKLELYNGRSKSGNFTGGS